MTTLAQQLGLHYGVVQEGQVEVASFERNIKLVEITCYQRVRGIYEELAGLNTYITGDELPASIETLCLEVDRKSKICLALLDSDGYCLAAFTGRAAFDLEPIPSDKFFTEERAKIISGYLESYLASVGSNIHAGIPCPYVLDTTRQEQTEESYNLTDKTYLIGDDRYPG